MAWVFDVSVAMAWCFGDESTPETQALLDRLKSDPATVPHLWHLEVANVLSQAIRRKPKARITGAQRAQFLGMLSAATVHLDSKTASQAWSTTLEIADQHKLSTYDAAYLELALRMGVELATLDKDLRKAGVAMGVKIIP